VFLHERVSIGKEDIFQVLWRNDKLQQWLQALNKKLRPVANSVVLVIPYMEERNEGGKDQTIS